MNRIAVIGSRGFDNYPLFVEKLEYLLQNLSDYSFVSGGALGTDSLIRKYARENNYLLAEYLPEYDKYDGKVAPIKRNHTIVENSDMLIAFWNGLSRGTNYTVKLAEKKGIPVRIVKI